MSPSLFNLSLIGLVGWNVWNQPFLESKFLSLSWTTADVHDEPVHFQHPNNRVVIHPVRQRPVVVKLADFEHVPNQFGFSLSRTFANTEGFVDSREFHVRCLAAIIKIVDPANGTNDTARPRIRLTVQQWRWAFPGQFLRQGSAQKNIFVIEVLTAKVIDHF